MRHSLAVSSLKHAVPALLLALPAAHIPPVQTPAPTRADVSWTPARPVQGSLILIEVAGVPGDARALHGSVAGEPLHFDRAADGRATALAAIPIDTKDSIAVLLRFASAAPMQIKIPVKAGVFGSERLTVDPKLARPPDSATAKRITDENALAIAVARASHNTPRLWRTPFVLPRATRVTDNYGRARVYNGEVASRHFGTDFAGAVGEPVAVTNNGVVALVADFYLAGKALYVDHGGGLVSCYFHLSEVSVAKGDTVKTGQIIGKVGQSGRVTGPHLHWQVRYGATSVDPSSLLTLGGAPPKR